MRETSKSSAVCPLAFNAVLFWLATAFAAAGEIPLSVTEPSRVARTSWPVTSGVPLGRGALSDHTKSALYGSDGQQVPLQTEVLSRWPDGSVRWLLLDFQASLAAGEERPFVLRYGADVRRDSVERPVRVDRVANGVEADTGVLRTVLSSKSFRMLDAVWLDRDGDGEFDEQERLTNIVNWDAWGNLEYDTARCFFTQYLRTGDRRYFDRASQAARHFLDVDVVHAVSPQLHAYAGSAKMRPGHVWLHQVGHTGGYYGRYDGERYLDEAPLILKGPYQLGMYNWGHQWIGGVFDYYLLTGDRRALEVATMTADTIAADCPTRYSDHIRDLGWPLNLVLAAYEATGKEEYLDAATRQWKLLQQHYDAERGFQVMLAYGHCSQPGKAQRCRGQNAYMLGLTLSGLARYHRITGDREALLGLTAGVNQLIRECWSEEHKSFYLTSCTHVRDKPPPALCSATALASEALAYESEATGNREHRRILRDAFQTMVNAGIESVAKGEQQGQTGYASMMFHFTPHALWALQDE